MNLIFAKKTALALSIGSLAAGSLYGSNAYSQESQESLDFLLEEVVVTSRRYEENQQDTPVAVSAMTGEHLENQGIANVSDVVLNSPGASFTQFNKMQAEYGMRGVSSQTEGASGDSSVSTIIDNVVISKDFMKNPAFFDMSRVEVLRGPQGTAFGRNASSGLVHLITARPEDEFSAGVTVDVGSHGLFNTDAFVTGALSDTVSGRLAVNFDSLDGYTEDTRTGDDLGTEENRAIRGSLLINPTDTLQIYLKAEYSEDRDENPSVRKGTDCSTPYQDADAPSVVGAPQPNWVEVPTFTDSCDPWETQISDETYLGEFFLDREIINLTAEVVWDMNNDLALTSVTGWVDGSSEYLIDAHGGPNNSMFQSTENNATTFSQEFRIDNHGSGAELRWLAGIYYMQDEHDRLDQNIFFVDDASLGKPGPNGFAFRPETRDIKDGYNETESLGIFGEVTYDITEDLNITAGLRYSKDEKEYEIAHYGWGWGGPLDGLVDAAGNNSCNFAPGNPFDPATVFLCGTSDSPVGFTDKVKTDETWENVSGKVSLQYALSEDKMVYGVIAQGYKTGGFQPEPINPDLALEPFDEETVTNVEVGFKGDFGDGFRFNVAAFYTEYDDLQMFLFKTTSSGDFAQAAENAASVEITGVEMDYIWAVNENLRFSGSMALIDAELVDALIDTDGDGIAEDFSGTRPDNTAEWTYTSAVEYDIPLNSGDIISLRADVRGNSEVYDDIGENEARKHDSYEVVGVRASYTPAGEEWSVALWGRNIFEEEYTTNVGPAQPNLSQLNFSYGAPRTYGITMKYNF